ncbi:hypothetical protein MYAM1_001790 [Malassezia yamatoensis]|uniref:DNA replication factor Cdt1 C-terminal domain-containing protein n=1 Tax=Malassezia yamatoensis TaxID=253288 RepID=A0AAJ5YYW1_9BASI|nr:hypothetical protein MYAM1_001790 [Malassezia yamatoensis]
MSKWELRAGRDAGTRVSPSLEESEKTLVRKRADSDDDLFLTPKSVRESASVRRARTQVNSLAPPAKLELAGSGSRLMERASPRRTSVPVFRPEEELTQERKSASEMCSVSLYEFDYLLRLPNHLQFLLDAHVAVEQSILVHMATFGAPAAERHDEFGESCLRITNVIQFHTLQPMVERTLRRNFTLADFKRLVWVWSHAPGSNANHTAPASKPNDLGGMGFLVSRARTIDPNTRRKAYDYAIGIEMRFPQLARIVSPSVTFGSPGNQAETRLSPSKTKQPTSSPSSRDEMSNLATWNNGVDERRLEFHRRLCHFVAMSQDQWLSEQSALELSNSTLAKQPSTPKLPTGYRTFQGQLTPTATRSGGSHAQRIRHEPPLSPPSSPLAGRGAIELPHTPPRTQKKPTKRPLLNSWHPNFDLDTVPYISEATLPALRDTNPVKTIVSNPPKPLIADPGPASSGATLEERIRAKEQAMHAARHDPSMRSSASSLHQRSMLSRLAEFAEAIYLLYSSSSTPAQSRQGRTSRVLPLIDVLKNLENSAK